MYDLGPTIGDRSDARNPALFRMFRLAGLAEEAGSGIPRIFAAWSELGFQPPEIDNNSSEYEFGIDLEYSRLLSDVDHDWLEELGSSWSHESKLALVVARHEGWIDNSTLRSVTGLHAADATRLLGSLRDQGLLRMVGFGRGARYELDPSVREYSLLHGYTIPGVRLGDSAGSTADSAGSTADSAGSTADSGKAGGEAGVDLPLEVGSAEWKQLEEIAMAIGSTDYARANERDEVIVQLCEVRSLSLVEIGWLINRNKQYLRSVLRELVAAGRLALLYPDRPRHPQQRYIAVARSGVDSDLGE